jgi:hypothetical protein
LSVCPFSFGHCIVCPVSFGYCIICPVSFGEIFAGVLPPVFSGDRVTRFLVLCVCFVDRCLFLVGIVLLDF